MALTIAICTTVFIIFLLFDLVPLIHQKKWKVIWLYCIMIATAYTIHLLYELGVDVPSPSEPIKNLVLFILGIKD